MTPIKVMYIMGAGRSGSTIAGIVLGNMREYFFAGELHLWNITKGKTFNDRKEVVDFWDEVAEHIPDKEEYFKHDFDKTLEFHTALPSLFFADKMLVKKFHEKSVKLFQAAQKHSGKQLIIDSSHYAMRAYWLNKNPALDVSYVYVYRDPVNVIHSFRKKNIEHKSRNFISSNIYLLSVSLLLHLIYWRLPKHKKIKIRYEDVLNCTQNTLKSIEAITEVPMEQLDTANLKTGFIYRSNRIRHLEKISLQKEKQEATFNKFLKLLVYILHSPFLVMHRRKCKPNL